MTLAGAEGWFKICELLRAEATVTSVAHCGYASPFTGVGYSDWDLDVNMAESPYSFAPHVASRKRGRDDDDDADVWFAQATRYEKVSYLEVPFNALPEAVLTVSSETTSGLRPQQHKRHPLPSPRFCPQHPSLNI